jgi:protein-disulfide isomerase
MDDLRQTITDRDHVLGPSEAPVTLVEYGDFECPHCGRTYPLVKRLLDRAGSELRFVFRHYPINVGHAHAQIAAEASEAAGAQGRFWEMAHVLFENQLALDTPALEGYAVRLGLDVRRFRHEMEGRVHSARVAEDVQGGDDSGVIWTPTFFVNGSLFRAPAEFDALARAVDEARRKTSVGRSATWGRRVR